MLNANNVPYTDAIQGGQSITGFNIGFQFDSSIRCPIDSNNIPSVNKQAIPHIVNDKISIAKNNSTYVNTFIALFV